MQYCLNLEPYLITSYALQTASGRHIYASFVSATPCTNVDMLVAL